MMSAEEIATARRLFFSEHWKIGTIAAHLGRHPDAIRRALNVDAFSRKGRHIKSLIDPYLGFIEDTLESYPSLRATRIHEMIVMRGFSGSIAQTRRTVRRLRPASTKEAYLRLQTLPGEQGQVDWANFGHVMVGLAKRVLSAFIMILSWSRAEAFEYFRGIPRVLLYDNLKSAVIDRVGTAIHFNPRLLEFSGHYHFEPRPVAVGRGNEKGRVERAIRFIRDRFFAARYFRDVDDLNAQFRQWREQWAHSRPCPGDKQLTVAEALEKEREVLLPLPEHRFPCESLHSVRSGKTPYVRFDLNDYSIPYELVRKPLSLYASTDTIRILDQGKEVARHARSFDRDQTIEDTSHISALAEVKQSARQSREMTTLFQNVPGAKQFLEQVVCREENLAAATRQLERLLEDYGADELTSAVAQALSKGTTAPSAVTQILEQARRKKRMKPPIRVVLSDDPRVRDLRVTTPKLGDYDDLAE
jgi:transposase